MVQRIYNLVGGGAKEGGSGIELAEEVVDLKSQGTKGNKR